MHNPRGFAWLLSFTVSLALPLAVLAEDSPAPEKGKPEASKEGEKKPDESAAKKPKIKKYDEVITTNAVTRSGLFRVHRIEESLFYEIPEEVLGVDLLWVVQISETTAGSSYAGMPGLPPENTDAALKEVFCL